MSLLEVENVTLKFGGVTAVNNVSFNVEEGEVFAPQLFPAVIRA